MSRKRTRIVRGSGHIWGPVLSMEGGKLSLVYVLQAYDSKEHRTVHVLFNERSPEFARLCAHLDAIRDRHADL